MRLVKRRNPTKKLEERRFVLLCEFCYQKNVEAKVRQFETFVEVKIVQLFNLANIVQQQIDCDSRSWPRVLSDAADVELTVEQALDLEIFAKTRKLCSKAAR